MSAIKACDLIVNCSPVSYCDKYYHRVSLFAESKESATKQQLRTQAPSKLIALDTLASGYWPRDSRCKGHAICMMLTKYFS